MQLRNKFFKNEMKKLNKKYRKDFRYSLFRYQLIFMGIKMQLTLRWDVNVWK